MNTIEVVRRAIRLFLAGLNGNRDAIYDEWYCIDPFSTDAVVSQVIRKQKKGLRVVQFKMDGIDSVHDIAVWSKKKYRELLELQGDYPSLDKTVPIKYIKPKKKGRKQNGIRNVRRQSSNKNGRTGRNDN